MESTESRRGRARRYDICPVTGFAHEGAAYAVAMLDELSERLFDLIANLSLDALDYVPEGTTNSIAMLVVHMAWAEAGWIARATHTGIPADLEQALLPGRQGPSGDLPPSLADCDRLAEWCRRVRDEITKPALASVQDIDLEVGDDGRSMTVRGVLMHLVWHWTYHSGQVGLLRRLWGEGRYQWTFGQRLGDPRP